MKKRIISFIGIAGIIVAIALVLIIHQQDEETEEYTNLFEYAVSLGHKDWTYAPMQLEFGMSMEEVLETEGLNKTAILEDDSEVVFVKYSVKNIPENIDELAFCKRFVVSEEYGLISVEYQLLVAEEDFKEVCSMLYEQAKSYMPVDEQVLIENMKDGKDVIWRSYDEADNLKSCVSFSADAVDESDRSKRIISLTIYIEPSYVKRLMK